VTDISGNAQRIQQLHPEKSQKLLGVMRNPIGNQQDEVARLQQKSDSIAMKLSAHALSRTEAKMAYLSFYLPAMRYSLAITSINQMDFEKIQAKATSVMLAALGFNRNMPRAVVFASRYHQGLGMRHLYDMQGCDSTRLLLQEICNRDSSTFRMLEILINTIQLESGIGSPILEDTRTIDYIEWGWIPQVREFLHHIDGKIVGFGSRPPRFREGDLFIMDSEVINKCTYKERMLIHRCRLHLQVEVLSDITNDRGDRIQDAWKNNSNPKPSRSTKKWPTQSDPGKEAWRIWRKFLQQSFENDNGYLKKPLGKWIQQNKHRTYLSYYDHSSEQLYRQDGQLWRRHEIRATSRRQMLFNKSESVLELEPPEQAIPIDIVGESNENWITGKNSTQPPTVSTPHRSPKNTAEAILADASRLENTTKILMEAQDIPKLFSNHTIVETASDGGFNPSTGISSFGWVVAANKTLIAMGRGPVAAHPELAESFRAEGYGLAAALLFLSSMTKHLKIDIQKHSWKFYIDNKAMIHRMQSYQWKEKITKWNLRPDADITNLADEYLRNFPASLIHVKSHQDEQRDTNDLPFKAQLNVLADAQATLQHDLMEAPLIEVRGLQPGLVIGDIPITRDSQKWILQKAGEVPITHHYSNRHDWQKDNFEDIDWDTQQKALATYPENDQRRILKFVHGWLPTNKHLFREGVEASPKCQLCEHLEESNDHLLACSHTSMENIRMKLSEYLWKDSANHGNSELNNILELAITECPHNKDWHPSLSDVSNDLQDCIWRQNQIGWTQILRGRITKAMISLMDNHYRDLNVDTRRYNGKRWGKLLIQNIWNTVLQLWSQRNEIIHRSVETRQKSRIQERLELRVRRCYEYKPLLMLEDRDKVFYKEESDLINEDHRYIKSWLRLAERTIRMAKKENTPQLNSRRLMENFFNWKPPGDTKKRTAAELQPD
jgi:hypothetical protein